MKATDNTDDFIIATNKTCYDRLGELYADGPADLEVLMEIGAWQEFLNSLGGKRILNVGCGCGDASKILVDSGYILTNTDLSEKMIAITAQKCPTATNLPLAATDLEQLRDEKFDGILAIHLIQHLSKNMLQTFFRQVYDLLAEDGIFFLVFTNTCYEKTGCQLEGGAIANNQIFWHKWKLEDVVPLLAKAHLQPSSLRQQKYVDKDGGYMEPFVLLCGP